MFESEAADGSQQLRARLRRSGRVSIKRLGRSSLLAVFCLAGWAMSAALVAAPADASVCAPGCTLPPDVFAPPVSATFLAVESGPLTASDDSYSASYIEVVYRDPANTYCASCLDFDLQIANSGNSTGGIATVSVASFSGFQADVGYTATGSLAAGGFFVTNGTVAPELVSRSASPGSVITWSFAAPLSVLIAPGQTSLVLVVQTDATNYTNGTVAVAGTGTAQGTAFAPLTPTVSTPEAAWVPAVGLLGGGLAGVILLRRRRRGRATAPTQ